MGDHETMMWPTLMWATTKQACRDELVVYLFFLAHILRSTSMWAASCEKGPDDMTRDFE